MILKVVAKIKWKLQSVGIIQTIFFILGYPIRRWRYLQVLRLHSNKDRFRGIYEKNLWNSKESASGESSEIAHTQNLREKLPIIINKYSIKTMVDAPCGDFNWMKLVLPNVDVTYYGFDIVDSVIEKNNKHYSSKTIKFSVADICFDPLPRCDLLIVRLCLVLLSYQGINKFFENIATVDYKYLLTTTCINNEEDCSNTDINTGEYRPINLFKEPFNFVQSAVLERIPDQRYGNPEKSDMILIQKKDVPIRLI